MGAIHKAAIGVTIDIEITEDGLPVDLSPVTAKSYIIRKPNGTKVTKTPDFLTTGGDGFLRYTTVAGDLDQAGQYGIQAALTFPNNGFSGTTQIGAFFVADNL